MTEAVTALLAICGALAVGVVSPGPSFLMVARTAVAVSRGDGVAAALGMGAGGMLFAVLALVGLHLVLVAVPWLYVALKVGGGAWLAYLGWRIWRGARAPLPIGAGADAQQPAVRVMSARGSAVSASASGGQAVSGRSVQAARGPAAGEEDRHSSHMWWRSFGLGFVTQVSNPKTALVYASVFAAFLPPALPLPAALILPPLVFAIETAWYALVALALSMPAPRAAYLRSKLWIDRIAGGVLAALGLKLIASARTM